MGVEWDAEAGRHRLAGSSADAPPLVLARRSDLSEEARAELDSEVVWVQHRLDGTTWVYSPDGTLVAIESTGHRTNARVEECAEGHRFLTLGFGLQCPECHRPQTAAPRRVDDRNRRRARRWFRWSYAISVVVLSAGLLVSELTFKEMTFERLLNVSSEVFGSDSWAAYWATLECEAPLDEVQSSAVVVARADHIGNSARDLDGFLELRVQQIRAIRIAPWHKELETARHRLESFTWEAKRRAEVDIEVMAELEAATHRADQPDIVNPWVEWEVQNRAALGGVLTGVTLAFQDASASTLGDRAAEVEQLLSDAIGSDCAGRSDR